MRYLRKTYPNILISGLAKTGTTILFSRVRESLSSSLKTFFEPSEADELNYILKLGQKSPTLTKCLLGQVIDKPEILRRFSHHVLIIRDPRDQLISEMLYEFFLFKQNNDLKGYTEASALLVQKIQDPKSISCSSLFTSIRSHIIKAPPKHPNVKLLAKKYHELETFRQLVSPIVVRYEDIVDNQLDPLAQYLGVDEILSAEVDREVKRVRRSAGYGEWKQWFTASDIDEFNTELGEWMLRYGYPNTPLPESQQISKETSLSYIKQFRPSR